MDPQTFCKWLAFQVVFGHHWTALACIVPLSDRVLLFFWEALAAMARSTASQVSAPAHELTCRWCSRFHTQRRSNERTDGTGSVKAGFALRPATADRGLPQQLPSEISLHERVWTKGYERFDHVWSIRGVWYAFSKIFSHRQSDEAKHIEHRRTLKLPRWGKIVRPQPRQRVVTLRAGEFIANALNIFATDDRKIQKRGP